MCDTNNSLCVTHLLAVPCTLVKPACPVRRAAKLAELRQDGWLVCGTLDLLEIRLQTVSVLEGLWVVRVHIGVEVVHDEGIVGL